MAREQLIHRALRLAALVSAAAIAWLAVLHLRMILSPAPMELREGAVIAVTRLVAAGGNPYDLVNQPVYGDVYGILYYLVMGPVARVFGGGFTAHRAVSALAIIGACRLLNLLLRGEGASRWLALLGTLLFYASAIHFVGPLSRPDALGLLLFLAGVFVLKRGDLAPAAFAGGLLLGLLAFTAKPYFVLPPFYAAGFVFLFRSRRRGAIYAAAALAAFIATLFVLARVYPVYVNDVLIGHLRGTEYDLAYMLWQSGEYLAFSLPLLAVPGAILARRVLRKDRGSWGVGPPDFIGFCAMLSLVLLLGRLGGNPGAYLTYYVQLLSPFAIILAVRRAIEDRLALAAFVLAFPVAIAWNTGQFPLELRAFAAAEETFAEIDRLIADHHAVLASPETVGLLALRDRPLHDTGQSEYFADAHAPDAAWLTPFVVAAELTRPREAAHAAEIRADIGARRFDLILLSRLGRRLIPIELVERHYRRAAGFDLSFPWTLQRWPIDAWVPR